VIIICFPNFAAEAVPDNPIMAIAPAIKPMKRLNSTFWINH